MNLRNFPTGVRLGAGFGVVIAILVGMVVLGNVFISHNRDVLVQELETANKKLMLTVAMKNALLEGGAVMRNIGMHTDVAAMQRDELRVKKIKERYAEARDKLFGTTMSRDERQIAEKLAGLVKKLVQPFDEAMAHAMAFNSEAAAKLIISEIDPLNDSAISLMDKLVTLQERAVAEALIASEARDFQLITLLFGLGLFAATLGVGCAWFTTRSITAPLKEAVTVAERIATGDLTSTFIYKGRDEIGHLFQALQKMNTGLHEVVSSVLASTTMIGTASREMATGNANLSSRTEKQAGSLEETAAAMEELTSTVRNSKDNARQANQIAMSASQAASRGGEAVAKVVETMASIMSSSSKIADISGVIDDLAFQTNILALNAAVEAARAGEQGRGFAVVASEVRGLAHRSASAAKEIRLLINEAVEDVAAGSSLVTQTGQTISEVVSSVKQVAETVNQISAATVEQTSGIEEVNQALLQMDEVTQQNAALVEQAAAAAESMQQQVERLEAAVAVFKVERV